MRKVASASIALCHVTVIILLISLIKSKNPKFQTLFETINENFSHVKINALFNGAKVETQKALHLSYTPSHEVSCHPVHIKIRYNAVFNFKYQSKF